MTICAYAQIVRYTVSTNIIVSNNGLMELYDKNAYELIKVLLFMI